MYIYVYIREFLPVFIIDAYNNYYILLMSLGKLLLTFVYAYVHIYEYST